MTDLDQRIAALREAVRQAHHTIKDEDGRIHHVQWYAIDLIDEQAAEIERLRARVAELEKPPTEQERWMNVSPLRDAGPTSLRGRITDRSRD